MVFRQGPRGREACPEYIREIEALPMGKCHLCGEPTREGDWFDHIDGYKGPLFNSICERCYMKT
jgi:hypothetical protein